MKHATRLLTFLTLCCFASTAPVARAQDLVRVELKGIIPKVFLDQALAVYGVSSLGDIEYSVVHYTMENFEGGVDTVSGLMVRVSGSGTAYPLAVYQHGTTFTKYDVPSRAQPGTDLSYLLATQGYVAIAPDYLNMGDDPDGFHPYVHARSEALAALRMIEALETLPADQFPVNGQLFLTGYSQGGHASMALHEVLIEEYPERPVTAAAHMSGPYSISEIMKDSVILRDETFPYLAFLPYTVLGYQAVYPELDQDLSEIFRAPYVPIIRAFRDGYAEGRVGLDSLTESLIRTYALTERNLLLYPSRLLTPEFVAAIQDTSNAFARRLRENDTYDFVNPTPTRLLYCTADDQVHFRNSLLARDSMRALGATDTEAVDVDPTADHGDCINPAVRAMLTFFARYQMISSDLPGVPLAETWSWRQRGRDLQVWTDDATARYRLVVLDAAGRTLVDRDYGSGETVSLAGVPAGVAVVRLVDGAGRTAGRSIVVP